MTQSLAADLDLNDRRVEFMCDYVLKTLKIKADKWMKMYNVDENKAVFTTFFEKPEYSQLLVLSGSGSVLSVSLEWPGQLKSKACYFVKKNKEPIGKDAQVREVLLYGDLSYSPVDQLSAFVDEVCLFVCLFVCLLACVCVCLFVCFMTSLCFALGNGDMVNSQPFVFIHAARGWQISYTGALIAKSSS